MPALVGLLAIAALVGLLTAAALLALAGLALAAGRSAPDEPSPPGMTMEQIVITGAGSVCVFVAVLVLVLRMSSRRRRDRRLVAAAASPRDRRPRRWEERSWSFGPEGDGEHGGVPGCGRPPGYGPPPLWTESRYDPRGWR